MGERGNIVFIHAPEKEGAPERRIYFYTHWRGHLLHEILREAMNHKELWPAGFGNLSGTVRESCRWYDASYFARVVFCKLVEGDEGGVLSFGIDVDRTLPDYDELHVDVEKKAIRQVRLDLIEGASGRWKGVAEVTVATWTFDEFASGAVKVALDDGADLGVSP
ncbi:MAG TPA: hypothetical protein VFH78_13675 [Candidatus Thermoplasmatota archaeon]|nr:hypothetical protein [Candidatus Thermoplasmatota archaeon]